MTICIERHHIGEAEIEICYTLDSGYHESHYAIESFQNFVEYNDYLLWDAVYLRENEMVEERLPKMSFDTFCSGYVTDSILKQFVISEMKLK